MSGQVLRGIHVNVWTPATDFVLARARPALVKSLDWGPHWGMAVRDHGIQVLVLRKWADDDTSLVPSPEAAAERLWARFRRDFDRVQEGLAGTAAQVYLETPWNEVHQADHELERHAAACVRWCELGHAAGWRVAVGNFSVTWPTLTGFPLFAPALAVADAFSCHEYFLPGNLNPGVWTARAADLYATLPAACPRPPVILTEAGIDGGLEARPSRFAGWRAYNVTAAQYAADLDAFAASQPPIVLGMALFNNGDYQGGRWTSFELAEVRPGDADALMAWIAAGPRAWTPPSETPEEPPMPDDTTWDPNPDRLAPVVSGGAIESYATLHRLVFASPEEFGGAGHSWAILLDPATDVAYRVEYTPRTGVRPFEQERAAE